MADLDGAFGVDMPLAWPSLWLLCMLWLLCTLAALRWLSNECREFMLSKPDSPDVTIPLLLAEPDMPDMPDIVRRGCSRDGGGSSELTAE